MPGRGRIEPGTQAVAEGIILGAVSGLVTGVSAGDDLFALRNVSTTKFLYVTDIRIRWATTTAFAAAQAMAFRVNKVYGFSSVHSGGSPKSVQAHYLAQGMVANTSTGDRVPLTELSAVIAGTGAMSTSTYTAEDTDEPDVFAAGAGSTLPGVYEDWSPRHGLSLELGPNEGLILNAHIAMGGSGVGNLYVGIDGFRV